MNNDELLLTSLMARGTDMLNLYHQNAATLPPVEEQDKSVLELLLCVQLATSLMNIDASLASIAASQQWLASTVAGAPHP